MLPEDSRVCKAAVSHCYSLTTIMLWPTAHAAQPRTNQQTPQPASLTQRAENTPRHRGPLSGGLVVLR